jgi:hypothetical protein
MYVVRTRGSAVSILVVIVMLLVPALAWMQYQWLGQLSTAERERMQRTLRTAAAQFANEFDSELSRTLVSLQVDSQTIRDQNWTAYAARYSSWVSSTSEPRLVRDVWLVDTKPGTTLPQFDSATPIRIDQLRLRRWNVPALTFEDAAWPEDLNQLRDSMASRFIGFQVQRGRGLEPGSRRDATMSVSLGDDTTLIAPVTLVEIPPDHNGPPKISILGFTVVRLDPAVIRDTVLAALTRRHFHGDDSENDYRVAVVKKDDPATIIWESEPGIAAAVIAAPDVAHGFMGPRPDQMFVFARNLRDGVVPPPPPPPPPGAGPSTSSGPPRADSRGGNGEPGADECTAALATTVGKRGHWVVPEAQDASRLINPGHPESSAVVRRVKSRRPSSQMPPLGSVLVDKRAVDLLNSWVEGMRTAECRVQS